MDHLGKLPSQIHRILDTDVESLPTYRRMRVRRLAGQEHASVPVRRCLPGHIGEPGDVGRAAKTIIRAIEGDERLAEVAYGRLAGLCDVLFVQHDARAPAV